MIKSDPPPYKIVMAPDEGMVQEHHQPPPTHRLHHTRTGDSGPGGALQTGDPPRDSIQVKFAPSPINDSIPMVENISWVVQQLKCHRSGGSSGMKAEHIQAWLEEATRDEIPAMKN